MRIFILRHAVAFARDPLKFPRDAVRPLTASGRTKMKRAARGMKNLGLDFDLILTSPLTRCRQTARIVVGELKPGRGPVVLRALAPGGLPRDVLAGIPKQIGAGDVLLVGHEPELSRLVSHLLLRMPGDMTLEFRKGGLCRIDFDDAPRPGAGRLALFLSPRVLRLMA